MKKVFGYPEFSAEGERVLCTYDNEYSDMLMDVRGVPHEGGNHQNLPENRRRNRGSAAVRKDPL